MIKKNFFTLNLLVMFIFSMLEFRGQSLKADAFEFRLTDNSQAQCDIILSPDSSPTSKEAAEILKKYLDKITGANFKIAEKAGKGKSGIYVGQHSAKQIDRTFSVEQLGTDSVVLKSNNKGLILAGPEPRGTIYSVYTFLEDYLGCRWWTKQETFIPKKKTLNIPEVNYVYTPALEYREVHWADANSKEWSVPNKIHRSIVQYKGMTSPVISPFGHSFFKILPPAKYFKDHPEWYSLVNGVRKSGKQTQLCLTNKAMRQQFIINCRQLLEENKKKYGGTRIFSIGQSDSWTADGDCECEACLAVLKKEVRKSGPVLRFVNTIAEALEKDYPKVTFSTFAYHYTRQPPKLAIPRRNVQIMLCSIECSFAQPLTHPMNKDFDRDMKAWEKISPRLYVWDYVTNFRHPLAIHPNLRVLGPNIRYFIKHKVLGIFEQGTHNTINAELSQLRCWMLSKLLWKPELKTDDLIEQFCTGYYGKAGNYVIEFINAIHDASEKTPDYIRCVAQHPKRKFISGELLQKCWILLEKAKTAAAKDDKLIAKIELLQLPVLYAAIIDWRKYKAELQRKKIKWPFTENVDETYDLIMKHCKKYRIFYGGSGPKSVKQFLKKVLAKARKK